MVPDYSWGSPRLLAVADTFQHFLERIMAYALEDHAGTVSIGGRPFTNLRFADDIDAERTGGETG